MSIRGCTYRTVRTLSFGVASETQGLDNVVYEQILYQKTFGQALIVVPFAQAEAIDAELRAVVPHDG